MKAINFNIFKNKNDFTRSAITPIRRAKDITRNLLTFLFSLLTLK